MENRELNKLIQDYLIRNGMYKLGIEFENEFKVF